MRINFNGKFIHPDAIFLDLDGTLLDDKKKLISKKNIEAIKKEQETSRIFISTGRNYNKIVKATMELIGCEYAVCQNGSLVVDKNGKIVLEVSIDIALVIQIVEFAKKNNLAIIFNSEKKIYSKRFILKLAKIFSHNKFFSFSKLKIGGDKINKIVLAGSLKRKMFKKFKLLTKKFPNLSICLSGDDYIIEITALYATKGIAANFLCDITSLDNNKSVHIGDSLNDASTLEYMYTMIAMKNSSKHLKKMVKNIGPNYKRGGVSKILKKDYSNF